MMKWLVVLSFVAGAALSWGIYVPVVHRRIATCGSFMFRRGSLFRCRAMLASLDQ